MKAVKNASHKYLFVNWQEQQYNMVQCCVHMIMFFKQKWTDLWIHCTIFSSQILRRLVYIELMWLLSRQGNIELVGH
jgi:hypothetical protein